MRRGAREEYRKAGCTMRSVATTAARSGAAIPLAPSEDLRLDRPHPGLQIVDVCKQRFDGRSGGRRYVLRRRHCQPVAQLVETSRPLAATKPNSLSSPRMAWLVAVPVRPEPGDAMKRQCGITTLHAVLMVRETLGPEVCRTRQRTERPRGWTGVPPAAKRPRRERWHVAEHRK